MKKILQYLFLFLFTVPFYSQVQSYYNDVDLSNTGNDLFLVLSAKLVATHTGIPYTGSPVDVWDACKSGDEDPDNAANVLLIYGYDNTDGNFSTDRSRSKLDQAGSSYIAGKWNREHVFAKSLAIPAFGTDEPGPGTDVHNLRPADQDRNSTRSNNKFTDGSGDSRIISTNGGWYPGDEWKGDIARIVMYMYTRYNGDGSKVSETKCLPINVGFGTTLASDTNMIDLFLKWNVEDPVSTFEENRNNILEGIQGNRNPFVDNPYLATVIWGGLAAEDKWNMGGSSDSVAPSVPTNIVASNITDTSATITWTASTDNVGVYDYLVYVNGDYLKSSPTTSVNVLNLSPSTTYHITLKARDAANNQSEFSASYNFTTQVGPTILFEENFNNCADTKFVPYNEASTKNWACEAQFGENNSGSYGINGYQEEVASKDWLITTTPIDFDANTGEKLSFYTDAAYGSSPLELVYSTDYPGAGNPADFAWEVVPNITIPIKSNTSSTEEIFKFSNVNISSITGSAYFAFKYYSNGVPTRWTVDSFKITAENENEDTDNDGVLNVDDLCPNTPTGESVDANGCSNGQLDDDNDGVQNSLDECANTPIGDAVNATGCAQSQLDDDNDGVKNNVDACANTPAGETVDANGCSNGQLDDDNDGVINSEDSCQNTPNGEQVDSDGCGASQLDDDNDGVMNNIDTCPNTPTGEAVDANGCSNGQLDDDNDGVQNSLDECANTPTGEAVNATGCGQSQLDDDNDGIMNNLDTCANTPVGENVNATGCGASQLDDDNDGVKNDKDKCPNTAVGITVDGNGCFTLASNNFAFETISETCPNKNNGQIKITANATHSYVALIDGTSYSFSNNNLVVSNLVPKTYDVCISVAGEGYEQCFIVKIDAGTTVSAKTSVSSKSISFNVEAGTPPFKVFVNNNEVVSTTDFEILINDIKQGDFVELKTAISCEGVVSKRIDVLDGIYAYPNPTKGHVEVIISDVNDEVLVEVFNMQSQLVSSNMHKVQNGKIQLNIEEHPVGIYMVKIMKNQQPFILKLIKE
ncbi:endonuclease [Lutibacter sp.]|uniref:endonuclease n=1 Tax=Lutibacter sp. TaxID=1925666 RepID=UPI001A1B1748|nr:endonuclease [Lutibacter sp.]MBI9039776.1 endonuclease [Lutibacter sp.]